jgi:hypothetical protein
VVPSQLAIYLRNHEAAATAGFDLFRRTVSSHRRKPYAYELRELMAEARDDLKTLRELMNHLKVPPDPVLGVTLRLGERAGRLKPNGRILRRAPLSDLVEVEGLLDAVHAKAAGWESLAAAGVQGIDAPRLIDRARSQAERLAAIHRSVAAEALNADW